MPVSQKGDLSEYLSGAIVNAFPACYAAVRVDGDMCRTAMFAEFIEYSHIFWLQSNGLLAVYGIDSIR